VDAALAEAAEDHGRPSNKEKFFQTASGLSLTETRKLPTDEFSRFFSIHTLPMKENEMTRTISYFLFLSILLLASCTSTRQQDSPVAPILDIPQGNAPNIDGILDVEEWCQAQHTYMNDGTEILWTYANGFLYLGIDSTKLGAANLGIIKGNEIWILHSSAALGSAIYEENSTAWKLVQDYSWCCRSTNDLSQMEQLLQEEGWRASIGYLGAPGQVEYQVALQADEMKLALAYISAEDTETVSHWPDTLSEETVAELLGRRKETQNFTTEEWATITIENKGE
jgi:hypothetical protein